jgi:hypothetical protein
MSITSNKNRTENINRISEPHKTEKLNYDINEGAFILCCFGMLVLVWVFTNF